jgi:hypothetical protein
MIESCNFTPPMTTTQPRFFELLIAFLIAISSVHAQESDDTTFYIGGIQVGEYDQLRWTTAMEAAEMNTVEVTVYARQGDWDSDALWFEEEDTGAINQIRQAKKAQLKVVLILRVALDHAYDRNKFIWHGMILPKTDKDLRSWFRKYRGFVKKWSKIAKEEGIEVLVVGSELNALTATVPLNELSYHYQFMRSDSAQRVLENRALKYKNVIGTELWVQGYKEYDSLELLINDRIEANVEWAEQITYGGQPDSLELMNKRRERIEKSWIKLIRKTRRRYSGKLSYASNFDNYFDVNFWDQLDFIGINAYFPLRDPETIERSEDELKELLRKGWESVFDDIERFRGTHEIEEIPLLFTELGYTHYENATMEPWSGFGYSIVGNDPHDQLIIWNQQASILEERALAISTLYEVVIQRSLNLQGLLYWKLTTMESQLTIEPFAILLSPRENGKDPALLELRRFSNQ